MSMLSRIIIFAALAVIFGAQTIHAEQTGPITIEKPFSRATPAGSKVGAGYMTITNKGTVADRLVSASSPAAGKVEIHEMSMQDHVMKMRELSGGLPIEGGKTVSLAPGGSHLMLIELKAALKQGDKVPVTLNFEKAGKVEVTLDVQAIGGQQPSGMSMPPSGGQHRM
jgi:periplasmic copper chaperone A